MNKETAMLLISVTKIKRNQIMDIVTMLKDDDVTEFAIMTGKLNLEDLKYLKEKFTGASVQMTAKDAIEKLGGIKNDEI